jgi:hypothetical protein
VLLLVSASVALTQHTLAALQTAMAAPAQQLAAQVRSCCPAVQHNKCGVSLPGLLHLVRHGNGRQQCMPSMTRKTAPRLKAKALASTYAGQVPAC